jgi:hypothetical protein
LQFAKPLTRKGGNANTALLKGRKIIGILKEGGYMALMARFLQNVLATRETTQE